MKFFTNKSIWTKIIIVLIFIILFEFIVAKPSLGADVVEFGGKLISPVLSLVVSLGDGILEIMHSSIMGSQETLIEVDMESTWWDILGKVVGALILAAFVAAAVMSGVGIVGIMGAAVKGIAFGVVGDKCIDLLQHSLGMDRVSTAAFVQENLPELLYLPVYTISPEEIFQGNILLFNVDFFSTPVEIKEEMRDSVDKDGNVITDANGNPVQEVDHYYYIDENGNEVVTSSQNIAEDLRGIISQWYVSLRNIGLVCMMIVLLYIGIRMLLSSVASDKAKYRQMLQDWLMGLLLLFLMHYIMAFSVTIVNKLTKVVSTSVDKNGYAVRIPDDEDHEISKVLNENGQSSILFDDEGNPLSEDGTQLSNTNDCAYIMYPTNLLGKLRLQTQMANWGAQYVGYGLCFLIMVCYTVFFVFTYLRRVLYMAFLTIIAPLVAVTYPIDKMNDGSAQGFDKWFKEYIFNLLIQPMHLLLYYVLVTSAFTLASENLLYTIVAIGFMIPAERLLRNLFGFEKAQTPGLLAGPAGAALAMTAINKLGSLKGSSKGSSGSNTSSASTATSSDDESAVNPRMNSTLDTTGEMAKAALGETDGDEEQQAINEMRNQALTDEERAFVEQEQARLNQQRQQQMNQQRESLAERWVRRGKQKIKNAPKRLGRYGKSQLYKLKEGAKMSVKQSPGGAIRLAGTAAGATALGAAALSAGIASGDPTQAAQYAAAGIGAGYALGGNIGDQAVDSIQTLRSHDNPAYNSRQYDDLVREDYIKNFRKENRDKIRHNFDKEEAKRMLDDGGVVEQFLRNNVNDADDIIAAKKMMDTNEVSNVKQASALVKYSKRVGNDYKSSNAGKWRETFSDEYQQKGYTKEQADRMARKTMDQIKKFNETKEDNYK